MAYKSRTASSSTTARSRGSGRVQHVSLPRRFFGLLFSPFIIAPLIVLTLVGAGVLIYYYQRYTALIDAGLRGDIFVRSSGIYAAPLELRAGGGMKAGDLVAHLKRVGYLERGSTQNEKRGVYAVRGNTVEVAPGTDAVIDGEPAFPKIKVSFASGGGVQSITDLSSRSQLSEAEVEPELISSVINQEREKRKIIDYKDLPQHLIDALVVIEDRQFFEHPGVNWRAIIRAFVRNYQAGQTREGGSTITQQLVKNFFLKPEKTLKRKLAEAYISVLLEHRLSKEQIMTMYCNQIYLGQRGGFSINGFGEAARSYFDKDISQLTLAESAMLVGIVRSPNHYAPFKHPDRAKDRRNFVIEDMVTAGKVTREEAEKAKQSPLGVKSVTGRLNTSDAPYFVDYLTKYVENNFDGNTDALRSLRIYSTIDGRLQQAAYQAVTKHMAAIEKMLSKRKGGTAGLQAALVAMDAQTGEVLAMVGGRDYASSQLNRATDAKRQPGSVFKPFVYAAALQTAEGYGSDIITPATMFLDAPRTFSTGGKDYTPGNFGDTYTNRYLTLRDALVHSKNVITVELAERIGFSNVAGLAARAGLPRPPAYHSMALGVAEATPLQVAAAYTTFANEGRRAAPTPLRRITSGTGATLFKPSKDTREVLSPQVAYVMTSMMQDVIRRGTGARVQQMGFTAPAAGKTGSSRDGWFAGYTPNLVCVVWVGFDDNSDLKLTGGATAAPIWAEFMMKALQLRPDLGGDFKDPGDITTIDIDPTTGMIAQAGTPNARPELFLKGTEPNHDAPEQPEESAPAPDQPHDSAEPQESAPPRPLRSALPARPGPTLVSTRHEDPLAATVMLEVCADTGLFPATNVCKRTARRRFTLGREPRDFCTARQHQRLTN
jgi:penicillin-binding protein 1B